MHFKLGFAPKKSVQESVHDLKIDFPNVLNTLADTPSHNQERKLMAIELQKFELEVEIITSKLRNANENEKLQVSSILGILWNNLHDFELLVKRVKILNNENESVVTAIIDTYYDFMVEHTEYIRKLSMRKRLDLAKLTYDYLVNAQKQRTELLMVMTLMQHEISKRYKLAEQLEECLNKKGDLNNIIVNGIQLMSNESENLRIIHKKLANLDDNKLNIYTVKGNYPRELSDWLKQSFYRKNYHCFRQLCQYIIFIFLPNTSQNIRRQFNNFWYTYNLNVYFFKTWKSSSF